MNTSNTSKVILSRDSVSAVAKWITIFSQEWFRKQPGKILRYTSQQQILNSWKKSTLVRICPPTVYRKYLVCCLVNTKLFWEKNTVIKPTSEFFGQIKRFGPCLVNAHACLFLKEQESGQAYRRHDECDGYSRRSGQGHQRRSNGYQLRHFYPSHTNSSSSSRQLPPLPHWKSYI